DDTGILRRVTEVPYNRRLPRRITDSIDAAIRIDAAVLGNAKVVAAVRIKRSMAGAGFSCWAIVIAAALSVGAATTSTCAPVDAATIDALRAVGVTRACEFRPRTRCTASARGASAVAWASERRA